VNRLNDSARVKAGRRANVAVDREGRAPQRGIIGLVTERPASGMDPAFILTRWASAAVTSSAPAGPDSWLPEDHSWQEV
jgi:hypothetical protein